MPESTGASIVVMSEIISRLDSRTLRVGDCDEWQGRLTEKGYGVITIEGKQWRVHRLSWTLVKGPIPEGLGVLHHCDNRKCRRLDHLFLGDALVNNRDRDQKKRGSCGKGIRHGSAKLTEDQVRAIRASTETYQTIADLHGIHRQMVYKIRKRLIWNYPDL